MRATLFNLPCLLSKHLLLFILVICWPWEPVQRRRMKVERNLQISLIQIAKSWPNCLKLAVCDWAPPGEPTTMRRHSKNTFLSPGHWHCKAKWHFLVCYFERHSIYCYLFLFDVMFVHFVIPECLWEYEFESVVLGWW